MESNVRRDVLAGETKYLLPTDVYFAKLLLSGSRTGYFLVGNVHPR